LALWRVRIVRLPRFLPPSISPLCAPFMLR
jgi:hypothetical protein